MGGMTVNDVVEQFGGTAKMAEIFGVLPSAVSNWKAANRIPPRLHYRLSRLVQERGIVIDESIFEDSSDTRASTREGAVT